VPGLSGNVDLQAINDPHDLDGVQTAILSARFAVFEKASG
jgi:hypothetical protein